jgi:hypothetical protein
MSKGISRVIALAAGVFGGCVALTGTALADTSRTATVGLVTILSVPVSACVSGAGVAKCVSSPSITPIPCPSGTRPRVGLSNEMVQVYTCTVVA